MLDRENPRVEKQVTFLIIPFAFKANFRDVNHLIDQKIFAEKAPVSERLYDYVQNLVSFQGEKNESIGRRFILKNDMRTNWDLPKRKDILLTYQYGKQSFSFSIQTMELYVFETGTGFVLLKIGHPENSSIEQMIETNYHLKRLGKHRNTKVFYERKTGKDTAVEQEISLNDLVHSAVAKLDVETFFEGDHTREKQCLVYSAALLQPSGMDEAKRLACLFRMQRAYKDSYKPVQGLKARKDIYIPFDNSYWGVSLEGMANLVIKTNDPAADTFFSTDYFYRLENTYLYMYILALHQRYALLYLSKRISSLPYELRQMEEQYVEQNERITEFRKSIVYFMLRCSYNQVSNMTHQSELYEMIRENLKIEYLFTEIHDELHSLASLTEINEQKYLQLLEEKKRERADKASFAVGFLSFFYLPLTIIPGLYTMAISIFTNNMANTHWAIGLSIISFIPASAILLWLIIAQREKSNQSKRMSKYETTDFRKGSAKLSTRGNPNSRNKNNVYFNR